MIHRHNLETIVEPVRTVIPWHNRRAADFHEAMRTHIANCAVRSYSAGLLIERAYADSSEEYELQFGIHPNHGSCGQSPNGSFLRIEHAHLVLHQKTDRPILLDSHVSKMDVSFAAMHRRMSVHAYDYFGLEEGYATYLELLGIDTSQVNADQDTDILLARIDELALAT